MASEQEKKDIALDPSVNINYPPSTSYPVKEDQAYWDRVAKNAAIVHDMEAVQQADKQERQLIAEVQEAAAQGAGQALDRREQQNEREAKRVANLERARAAKRQPAKEDE
jgi:hypothetical protein